MIPKRFRPAVLYVAILGITTVFLHTISGSTTWLKAFGVSLALEIGSFGFVFAVTYACFWAFGK